MLNLKQQVMGCQLAAFLRLQETHLNPRVNCPRILFYLLVIVTLKIKK